MDKLTLFVKDFSRTPGTRYRNEGAKSHSGEEFREDYLIPSFKQVLEGTYSKLIINLDGTIGYGTSWLEEVFGGITRELGKEIVLSKMEFISEEEPYLIEDIIQYINHAEG